MKLDELNHPMQPVGLDDNCVFRFKPNKIVQYLFHAGKLDLNQIAIMDFSDEDRMQLVQLLGYSVDGYSCLSYVSNESLLKANKMIKEREGSK